MSLAERLRDLMNQSDLSARELGRKIGASHVSIGKWLSGVGMPTDENLEALANYFQVTPAFLRYGYEDASKQSVEIDENTISIPVLGIEGSCGFGDPSALITLVKMLRVEKGWLFAHAKCPFSPLSLHIITADGDSMEPSIKSGDFVIIDTSQRAVTADALYAVQYGGSIFIKRVQMQPNGKLLLMSDNPAYKTMEVENYENVSIVGRCIISCNARAL